VGPRQPDMENGDRGSGFRIIVAESHSVAPGVGLRPA
jgi:hypothetical protein